jgi:zinc transport system substrate-binding protein
LVWSAAIAGGGDGVKITKSTAALLMGLMGLLSLLLLSGCGQKSQPLKLERGVAGNSKALTIYTVNYPLAWAAGQLVGDDAQVQFPAPADIDPAFWQPDLDTIAAYQQADLIVLNGANYAKWIGKVSLPQNRLLNTSQAFADQLISLDSAPLHSHGPQGDHSHGELAFTVWLDLTLLSQQVSTLAEALSGLLPDLALPLAQRRAVILEQLQVFDGELASIGKLLNAAPLLYSHPVYQYLQRRYQLNGKALHWEPGEHPGQVDWSQLDALLQTHPARIMLWEAEPLSVTRAQLEKRGIEVVVFQPMGNRPSTGDFIGKLQAAIANLAAVVHRQSAD